MLTVLIMYDFNLFQLSLSPLPKQQYTGTCIKC